MSSQNENNNFKASNVIMSESSDAQSLSARVYNALNQNKLFNEQEGGKKKKSSKKSSRKTSKKTSRKKSSKKSKRPSKKESKSKYSKHAKESLQEIEGGNSLMSDSINDLSEVVLTKNLNSPQDGGRKKKSSKKSKSKGSKKGSKRALPESMQAFQKIVAHMATTFGRSPTLLRLVKVVRDEVMKSNPNLSPMDIAKKSIEHFDKNKEKFKKEFDKMKSEAPKPKSKA